jgi:hypothetical protein
MRAERLEAPLAPGLGARLSDGWRRFFDGDL